MYEDHFDAKGVFGTKVHSADNESTEHRRNTPYLI